MIPKEIRASRNNRQLNYWLVEVLGEKGFRLEIRMSQDKLSDLVLAIMQEMCKPKDEVIVIPISSWVDVFFAVDDDES